MSDCPTFRGIVEEAEPLLGTIPVYGPPVALVAVPWLFFGLMLAGPFALLCTLVVALVAAAAVVRLVAALLAAPYRLVRALRREPRAIRFRRHVSTSAVAGARVP